MPTFMLARNVSFLFLFLFEHIYVVQRDDADEVRFNVFNCFNHDAGGDNRNTRDNFKCVYWSDGFVTGGSKCPSKEAADAIFSRSWLQ